MHGTSTYLAPYATNIQAWHWFDGSKHLHNAGCKFKIADVWYRVKVVVDHDPIAGGKDVLEVSEVKAMREHDTIFHVEKQDNRLGGALRERVVSNPEDFTRMADLINDTRSNPEGGNEVMRGRPNVRVMSDADTGARWWV